MLRSHYSIDVCDEQFGSSITVAGWVEDIRNIGSIAFIIIRDKKGTLQVTALKKEHPELFEKLVTLPRESVVSIMGLCQESKKARNGYEVIPKKVSVLSLSESPLPLGIVDKVEAELDTRLDNRFLDLRKPVVQAIFQIRSAVIGAVHDNLRLMGFEEVHTPKLIGTSSEGGTDVFKIGYFDREAFLAQSPQLYKQMLMSTGLDRVYEIAWYFRAEEHNTRRHLNESTAVDVEMAFIENEEDVMRVLEELVSCMWLKAGEQSNSLIVLDKSISIPKTPFRRVTYDEALSLLADRDCVVEWGEDLGTEEERLLGSIMSEENHDFYFITRYPLSAKPFYTMPENNMYSRGFDLACRGVELASGSQRIHDITILQERMKTLGLDTSAFESYLKSFRFGMPPHGGFGFGIERFMMELLNISNIRECILFPRDRTRLYP
ncbi:MAG: aspartate--tRNA(Asn) ligase [Candidatus Thermoplasmatota archaeon]|nr:aspartate--tRNA(Asn) ligase [Candidatus Thermoplasmatota archaeon]